MVDGSDYDPDLDPFNKWWFRLLVAAFCIALIASLVFSLWSSP